MPNPNTVRSARLLKLLWIAGILLWCTTVAFLIHRQYEAQSLAEASRASGELEAVALAGTFWSVAGATWLTRLRKARTSQVQPR